MVVDGVRYTHVLDPRSGWPVTGLASASVIGPQCLVAGTATTIALLKGARDGARFLDSLGLPNLRVDSDGRLSGSLASRGVADPQ
jgi:thiamine biosynthesis lipoprotein